MLKFVLLSVALVIAVVAFITYPIIIRKMVPTKFHDFCEAKIKRISLRRNCLAIPDLKIRNLESKPLKIDHVLFGKKYIYIISDFALLGDISGDENNNSWIYLNNVKKATEYLDNLKMLSKQNTKEFAEILGINEDAIVSVILIPNEATIYVKNVNESKNIIVHYSSFNRLIRRLERLKIGELNIEQIKQHYESLVNINGQEHR